MWRGGRKEGEEKKLRGKRKKEKRQVKEKMKASERESKGQWAVGNAQSSYLFVSFPVSLAANVD